MSVLSCPACGKDNSEFNRRCASCGAAMLQESLAQPPWGGDPQGSSLREQTEAEGLEGTAEGEAAAPGADFGPYRLRRRLGRGSMGVVSLAEERRSGRRVALKTVRLPRAELLPVLRREIHALSRLRHPGIVPIAGSGAEGGVPWMAMELKA